MPPDGPGNGTVLDPLGNSRMIRIIVGNLPSRGSEHPWCFDPRQLIADQLQNTIGNSTHDLSAGQRSVLGWSGMAVVCKPLERWWGLS